jgi:hypothetical protein
MRSLPLVLVLVCAACSSTPDTCATNPALCQDAGTGGGEGAGPGSCTGVCLPSAPKSDWLATILLWVGPESATPPTCPSVMAGPSPGFADTPPTVSCPQCQCSPSVGGTCFEPDQLTANSGVCPEGTGGAAFGLPQGWDGKCEATNLAAAFDSVTVAMPSPPGASCAPEQVGSMSVHGPTQALACSGEPTVAPGTCGDQSMVCAFPASTGFMTCIQTIGKATCPAGWPTRHVVYYNELQCGCTCGAPVGDSCSATVSVYKDGACSQSLGSVVVSTDKPQTCLNVPAGSGIKGVSAGPPTYTAGTCTASPGGPAEALTFCCLP